MVDAIQESSETVEVRWQRRHRGNASSLSCHLLHLGTGFGARSLIQQLPRQSVMKNGSRRSVSLQKGASIAGSIDTHPQGVKGAVTRPNSAARNHAFRTLSAPFTAWYSKLRRPPIQMLRLYRPWRHCRVLKISLRLVPFGGAEMLFTSLWSGEPSAQGSSAPLYTYEEKSSAYLSREQLSSAHTSLATQLNT